MNELIDMLYKKIDYQDKLINQELNEIARLKCIIYTAIKYMNESDENDFIESDAHTDLMKILGDADESYKY